MKKLKDNWYWVAILTMAIVIFFLYNNTANLSVEIEMLEISSKEHKINSEYYKELYDAQIKTDKQLSTSYDSLFKVKIKIQTNEKIKFINTYTVSSMQSYFTDRYGSK